jgi:GMP synthase (glutamine-hydrolysing)
MNPVAVVVQHELLEGPGMLEDALEHVGFDIQVRYREVRSGDEDADLIVVLGGTPGAHEPELSSLLVEEVALLRHRLENDRPCLGICLGSQLLASAAGADVYTGSEGIELGVLPVRLTDAGHEDPVFGPLPEFFEAMHWHGDTFDRVPGATLLASSEKYPHQAFRIQRSYGTQFHPEITPRMLRAWFSAWEGQLNRAGRSYESMVVEDLPRLADALPITAELIHRLAVHFAECCAD